MGPTPRSHHVGSAVETLRSYELIRGRQQRPPERGQAAATRIVVAALTESLPRCLTPSVYRGTVAQGQQLVDGLDAETCLACEYEIAPDDVPSFDG
jgi:hypothetical protein